MKYHFPEITVGTGHPLAQVAKVMEEAGECLCEVLAYDTAPLLPERIEAMCGEAWDTLQAAESLVRALVRMHPAYMAAAKFKVIEKCYERGYYDKKKERLELEELLRVFP